jgi:starch synthase
MKVLFVASECAPFIKVGGLGDVVGSLPKALSKNSVDTAVVIPAYKTLFDENLNIFKNRLLHTEVRFANATQPVTVYKTNLPESQVPVYLIDNPAYISNGGIYQDPTAFASGQDEINRFAFFSKSVVSVFLENPSCDFKPDIIHCHDWHTGLIPNISKRSIPTIFTIHNLANQGFSATDILDKLEIGDNKSKVLSWDAEDSNIDFILQGIVSSDYITTVSPTYAKEILTPVFGEGLHEVLRAREGRIYGILNGIDYRVWNPKTDTHIKTNFDKDSIAKKRECKFSLQHELNLPTNAKKPLLSFIGRLTTQKGVDMIISLLDEMLVLGCQIVILGTGDPSLENRLRMKSYELEKSGLFEIRSILEFNEDLAHKIYAGSDVLLVPSRFEPCGLTQMIAMRYGTIPLARRVGGLLDSVRSGITGFTFDNFDDSEFLNCIKRTLNYYSYESEWQKIVLSAMEENFSWEESARKYVEIYNLALGIA